MRFWMTARSFSLHAHHDAWSRVIVLLVIFCGSGATCVRPWGYPPTAYGPPAPAVLTQAPTLNDVITAINMNAARVQSFTTHNATISMLGSPGTPALTGSIAMERPRNFRLQAGLPLLGPQVDLGSNDSDYWLWVRQANPPAVYVGRHDLAEQSAARQVMPVKPTWFLDALGLAEFDATARHEGPIPRPADGTVEIRSTFDSPEGPMTKVSVIDLPRAWVMEQHVYGPTGTLVASAVARAHRYYPDAQVSLPQIVEIHLPAAKLDISIDVGNALINQPLGDPAQLWAVPRIDGFPAVSLDGDPNQANGMVGIPGGPPVTSDVVPPQTEWRSP